MIVYCMEILMAPIEEIFVVSIIDYNNSLL